MLLVIDTASAACSVALMEGRETVDERHEVIGRGHAERLLPIVEELLSGRRPDAILVDCGPGSFTGLRVGLSAAHGLAIGWQVPLSGFSAMALIAASVEAQEVAVAVLAGHDQLFVQSFRHGPLAPLDELRSLSPQDAAAAVSTRMVVGSGAESLVSARGHGDALEAHPRASHAMLLPAALRSLEARPIYGRAPDARPMR